MNYLELVLFGWHRHIFYPLRPYSFPLLLAGIALVAYGIALREKVHATQKIGQFLIALGAFTFPLALLLTDWSELTNWFVGTGWFEGSAEHYNWFFGYYCMGVDGIPRGLAYYTPFPSALFGIYLIVFGLILWFVKKKNPSETQLDRSHKEKVSQDHEQRLFGS